MTFVWSGDAWRVDSAFVESEPESAFFTGADGSRFRDDVVATLLRAGQGSRPRMNRSHDRPNDGELADRGGVRFDPLILPSCG